MSNKLKEKMKKFSEEFGVSSVLDMKILKSTQDEEYERFVKMYLTIINHRISQKREHDILNNKYENSDKIHIFHALEKPTRFPKIKIFQELEKVDWKGIYSNSNSEPDTVGRAFMRDSKSNSNLNSKPDTVGRAFMRDSKSNPNSNSKPDTVGRAFMRDTEPNSTPKISEKQRQILENYRENLELVNQAIKNVNENFKSDKKFLKDICEYLFDFESPTPRHSRHALQAILNELDWKKLNGLGELSDWDKLPLPQITQAKPQAFISFKKSNKPNKINQLNQFNPSSQPIQSIQLDEPTSEPKRIWQFEQQSEKISQFNQTILNELNLFKIFDLWDNLFFEIKAKYPTANVFRYYYMKRNNALVLHAICLKHQDQFPKIYKDDELNYPKNSDDLERKLMELKEILALYEQEIHDKEKEITNLKQENLILTSSLESVSFQKEKKNKRTENDTQTLLKYGKETDLYADELLSFIHYSLENSLKNQVHENSRFQHIIMDLLQANPIERDLRKEKDEQLHRTMNNYTRMDNPTRQALTNIGFHITDDGAHYKLVFLQDGRYTFTTSKTSSDGRAGKNFARDVANQLF